MKNTSQVKASALPPDSPPLNFEGSSPEPDEEALPPQPPELDPAESSSGRRQSIYELPSMSQMDTSVFNHLPDDLKAEILGEYKRKGVVVDGIRPGPSDPSAGSSTSAEGDQAKASASVNDPAPQGRSYDAIRSVTDIDPDYWAALPDEIKAEIEGDIRRRLAHGGFVCCRVTKKTSRYQPLFDSAGCCTGFIKPIRRGTSRSS